MSVATNARRGWQLGEHQRIAFYAACHSVGHDAPTVGIDHNLQIDEAALRADIGRAQRPYLAATLDDQLPEQVRVHLVLRIALVGPRLRVSAAMPMAVMSASTYNPTGLVSELLQLAEQLARTLEGKLQT
jgi:hypothetical protein